ncbi:MAG: arsinothricin resistance N-acetyltransferase ArsN1 family B [Chthonomonadales bacterium]
MKDNPIELDHITDFTIRLATPTDANAIAAIYNHYIRETIITFEEEEIDVAEMLARMAEVDAAELPWFVAERDGQVIGYAYAGKWKSRSGYRYAVEATVYLDPHAIGRGAGTALYTHLIAEVKRRGAKVVIGGVALPNPASVALHEKMGMKKVAHFESVGYKFDTWIDVAYWQITFDD